VIGVLGTHAGLTPRSIVADVGAGTGIFSRLLLAHGCTLYAVEPNREMRAAAEQDLAAAYPATFRAIDGRAEATTLSPGSVDLVVSAQAFHWFDRVRAAAEFRRILRPDGHVAIVFNERKATESPFLAAYDELLKRWGTDYKKVAHGSRSIDETQLATLFEAPVARFSLPNRQVLDWSGLRGRLMSASYTPLAGQPGHDEIFAELRALYDRCEVSGLVELPYETEIFVVRSSGEVGR
jgi:SAM-dependent methyltransferase